MLNKVLLGIVLCLSACSAPTSPKSVDNAPSASPSINTSPRPIASESSLPLVLPSLAATMRNQLRLTKHQYGPGERIEVHFQIRPEDKKDPTAWIGIVSAAVPHGSESENDKFDVSYQYLEGRLEGSFIFEAPTEAGRYDLRLHDSDEAGLELAFVTFEVTGPVVPITGNQLVLGKERYKAGELIEVTVSIKAEDKQDETAWVGLIPAAVAHGDEAINDRFALDYRLMGKYLSGKMLFKAPSAIGLYDLRLHSSDTNGKELEFVSFLVE